MTNLDDNEAQVGIVDGIKNPVVSLSNTVELVTGEFFGARGSGVSGKLSNLRYDAPAFFGWQSLKLLDRGRLDLELIVCHGVAGSSERSRNRGSAPSPEFGRQQDLRRLPQGFVSRPC